MLERGRVEIDASPEELSLVLWELKQRPQLSLLLGQETSVKPAT